MLKEQDYYCPHCKEPLGFHRWGHYLDMRELKEGDKVRCAYCEKQVVLSKETAKVANAWQLG